MKYIELPIDDSKGVEQFKVGDLVRVYSDVYGVLIEGIDYIKGDLLRLFNGEKYYYKQCRKLIPVEPRERYLCMECNKHFNIEKYNPFKCCGEYPKLFREVLDE